MKIHEYQGKAILKKYGVAVPRGTMATTREEAEAVGEGSAGLRRDGSGGQGADPRRRTRQGRRSQNRQVGGRSGRTRRQDAGHEAGHASDGAGRAHRASLAGRRNVADREGTLSWHSGGSRRGQAGVHGVGRGRHGYRASGGRKSGRDSEAIHRSGHGPGAVPGAQDRVCAGAEAAADQSRRAVLDRPLSRVPEDGCFAGGDQSVHQLHRRPAVRARCQVDLRR